MIMSSPDSAKKQIGFSDGKSGALGESRGVDGWFLLKQVVLKNVRSKLLKFTLGIW